MRPNQQSMGLRGPVPQQKSQEQLLWEAIGQVEQNMAQMVNHINTWVAKIQGIDNVAFAALALHEGKEFKLTTESVEKNQKHIQAVIAEMGRYRDEAAAAAKAEEEAAKVADTAKPAKKKKAAKDGVGTDNSTKG